MLLAILQRFWGRQAREDVDVLSDEELMLEFARGNQPAFEELVSRHEGPLFRFILRSVTDRPVAEELTQEVFLRICKAAPRYTKKAKFTTWAFTIARNLCIDASRRRSGKRHISLDAQTSQDDRPLMDTMIDNKNDSASSTAMRAEFRRKLTKALDELPEEQREVFVMRQVSGLKFREIAKIIGVSENTIKSRMRYALEALRGHLAAYEGFSFDHDNRMDLNHT